MTAALHDILTLLYPVMEAIQWFSLLLCHCWNISSLPQLYYCLTLWFKQWYHNHHVCKQYHVPAISDDACLSYCFIQINHFIWKLFLKTFHQCMFFWLFIPLQVEMSQKQLKHIITEAVKVVMCWKNSHYCILCLCFLSVLLHARGVSIACQDMTSTAVLAMITTSACTEMKSISYLIFIFILLFQEKLLSSRENEIMISWSQN